MNHALQILSLLFLAAGPSSGRAEEPASATDAQADPAPSLRERLDEARARSAPRCDSALQAEREQRRLERMRPLAENILGAVERRKFLGDRTLPSADDRRLGAAWRRQVLAGRPIPIGSSG